MNVASRTVTLTPVAIVTHNTLKKISRILFNKLAVRRTGTFNLIIVLVYAKEKTVYL